MGVGQVVLLCSGVLVLLLGFILYTPVHPDTDEPFKVQGIFALLKLFKYLGDIGELFGYDHYITERYLSDKAVEFLMDDVSDGIVMSTSVFDGVNVRIFEPKSVTEKARQAVIYFHGGYFAIGSSLAFAQVTDLLALYLDAVVISVDYRLMPEHPFPAAFNDCHTVAMYTFRNARKLRINPSDIGVVGDSAGAAFATSVAQKFRDDGENFQLRYQVLIYPGTQVLTLDLPSHHTSEQYNPPVFNRPSLAEAIIVYIGEKNRKSSLVPEVLAGNHTTVDILGKYSHLVSLDNLPRSMSISKEELIHHYGIRDRSEITSKNSLISHDALKKLTNPYAFPLMAETLKNLPPALVITCEWDPLRDDGFLYVRRLKNDGVEVVHKHKRDTVHASISFVKFPFWLRTAHTIIQDIVNYIDNV